MSSRAHRWLLALLVSFALAGSAGVLLQSRTSRQASDFTFYYAAALLLREGEPAAAYDQPALGNAISRVAPGSAVDRRLPFNLPLAAVLPLVPLTLLPLDVAFRFWQFASLGLLVSGLLVLRRAFPLLPRALGFALLGVLAAVPTWSVLSEGQLTPLLLVGGALLLLAFRTNSAWPAVAGGLLLAIKPHFLPAYLIVLLAGRNWRPLVAAAGGAALMLLSPLAAGGVFAMEAFARNALSTNSLVSVRLTEAWTGLLAQALPPGMITSVSLALYTASLIVLTAFALRLAPAVAPAFAALALWLAMPTSPHVLPHDLLLLAVPAWLAFFLFREHRLPSPIIPLLLVQLALLFDLRGAGSVLGPIAMTAVAAWALYEFRRQADRRLSAAPAAAA